MTNEESDYNKLFKFMGVKNINKKRNSKTKLSE
jgi:hypothetical protein